MNLIDFGTVGSAASAIALALAVYAMVAGAVGAVRRDARLQTSARLTAVAVFLATTTAIVVMVAALLTDDFSVKYVAEHSRIDSPVWVKVVTLWAALEGSILLWAWLLTAYAAVMATTTPNTVLRPWALAIMQGVTVFFLGVVVLVANPFIVLANPPLDGPGANPLLQNHWMMAVHPVLMYLGFVGLTVPFSFAMAALVTRRPGTEWMAMTRRWTLAGWGFLTAAIISGGWWSYEVLGWGGYWAWDPVENVSFMPWLTATAFLHSVQVQERRRMLKSWNVLLIVLTFALSILGTFLTRSGVVSSVHAFGDGPVGPVFLAFFFLVTIASLGLVAWRWDQVRDRAELDAAVSREGAFLTVNVLFLAMTFAVLIGTLFPLIVEAINGARVTVGAPFFDQTALPMWMIVLLLMGVGPLLPWRKAESQSLRRNLTIMTVALRRGGRGRARARDARGVPGPDDRPRRLEPRQRGAAARRRRGAAGPPGAPRPRRHHPALRLRAAAQGREHGRPPGRDRRRARHRRLLRLPHRRPGPAPLRRARRDGRVRARGAPPLRGAEHGPHVGGRRGRRLAHGHRPLLPWRKAETQSLRRNLTIMTVAFAVAVVGALALGMRAVYPVLTIGLAGWNLASVGLLLAGAVVPRARLARRGLAATTLRYAFEQRRKVGSMVVHLGVIVVALGIVGSSGYRTDVQVRLPYGERVATAEYELEALRPFAEQTTGRTSVGVEVAVWQGDRVVQTLRPRINVFGQNSMAVPTAAVRYTFGHDLYLSVAGAVDPNADGVIMRVVRSPLIVWVWLGGVLMAIGTGWALSPMANRRTATADAPLGERAAA